MQRSTSRTPSGLGCESLACDKHVHHHTLARHSAARQCDHCTSPDRWHTPRHHPWYCSAHSVTCYPANRGYPVQPYLHAFEYNIAGIAQAEHDIFQRFRQLTADRTVIFISHRFSTVRLADRIFVIDQGELTEQGSHQELLNLGGTYAELFHLQAQAYL